MCTLTFGKERHLEWFFFSFFFFKRQLPPCLHGHSARKETAKKKKNRLQLCARWMFKCCEGGEKRRGGLAPLLFSPPSSFFPPRAAFRAFLSASWGEGPCWQTQAKHYYSALQFLSSQPLLLSFSLSFYSSSDTLLLFNPFSRSLPSPPPLLSATSVHPRDVGPGLH